MQKINTYTADLIEGKITRNYNKYKLWTMLIFTVYAYCYIKHNFTQPEFSVRERPNILIPKSVYEVRRKHYIYWELSRIARGYRKTFSYYNYDKESKLLYFVDRDGNNYIEKIIFNEERPDLLENPFLEFLLKSKPWNDQQLEEANKISAYYLSLNNKYDLDNYLHYKSINLMDWIRWVYYKLMIYSGMADTYRYEQFLKKNDSLYNLELLLLCCNLNTENKKKVLENLMIVCLFLFISAIDQVNKMIPSINKRPKS